MSQTSPPPYLLPPLSEASAPNYSPRPLRGEQSLCYRPGHGLEQATASDVNDVFVHSFNDSVAILLERQSKNISIPTYAKCGKISGNLLLEPHLAETVTLVVLEIHGVVTFDLSHAYDNMKVLDYTQTLFCREHSASTCSSSLPVSFSLPSTFSHADTSWSLPPSYLVSFGEDGTRQEIRCKYFVRVLVTTMLHRRVPMLTTTQRYELTFRYLPRSRPIRPLFGLNFSGSSFLSLLKQCPEEWRQFVYTINAQKDRPEQTFTCQIYLPSAGAYAIREDIPFFIQMSGEPLYLSQLQYSSSDPTPGPVSVFILRQVIVEFSGRNIPFHFTIGSAEIEAIPPALSIEENLNWQGILRVHEDITVPTFQTARLAIQDFIVLEVYVHDHKVRHGHAISLVTESWSELAA